MSLINSENLSHIIRRALNYIDERLVGHGERVAYIVGVMLEEDGSYTRKEQCGIAFTALLHDIGAYETEEIDNMVQFESKDVWAHSIYGYLFVKHFSPFEQYAPLIFYHHVANQDLERFKCPKEYQKLAQILNLADRAAIYYETTGGQSALKALEKQSPSKFSPEVISLLRAAEEHHGVLSNQEPDLYEEGLRQILKQGWLSKKEIDRFLQMLVFSIDFRSRFTVAHTFATAKVSGELGRLFELDDQTLEKIKYGALLHDMGKIGIPLEILESPGRLNDEEMSLMRTHVLLSGKIIEGLIDEETARIALRHHEKLDGSGYPEGLTEKDLTIPERIVAVGDIVSALNGERSYKKSFSPEKIKSILHEMKDSGQLCPKVIDVMLSNYDDIMWGVHIGSEKYFELFKEIEKEFIELEAEVNTTHREDT